MNLLNQSTKFSDRLITIGLGFCAILIWWVFFYTVIDITYNFRVDILSAQFGNSMFPPSALYLFTMSCIVAPLWEELVFRHSILRIFKNSNYVLYITIIASCIFGWLHNNAFYHYGVQFQGVFGFVFAWVYIRNGYHYWSSVALHAMWNYTVFMVPYLM